MHVFLSYNHGDKQMARPLAARLQLIGGEVWFDEWKVRAGDSIVGKVNDALDEVDTAVVLWSSNAAASRWVGAELDTALTRALDDGSVRVVPVRLDDSELPPLLRRVKWVEMESEEAAMEVARQIAGLASDDEFRKAVQAVLDSYEIELRDFLGYGVMVGSPVRCAALGPRPLVRH